MSPSRPPRLRLDALLVERGLCASRAQARGLILAGKVRTASEVLDKPGKSYPLDLAVTVVAPPRFVSRGGEKLEAFLEAFPVPVEGRHALDVGASTGGFTDCLLQRGAVHVTAVDVGRAQLHGKLLADARVTNIERLNARALAEATLPHPTYPLVVMDLSFISLRLVLPTVWPRLAQGGDLVALVKPQFEATKAEADRGKGIIRDPAVRERIVAGIRAFATAELAGAEEIGHCTSPLEGADGNVEFLVGWHRGEVA